MGGVMCMSMSDRAMSLWGSLSQVALILGMLHFQWDGSEPTWNILSAVLQEITNLLSKQEDLVKVVVHGDVFLVCYGVQICSVALYGIQTLSYIELIGNDALKT